MDKIDIHKITAFNNLLKVFIAFLKTTFPNEKSITMYEAKLKLATKANPFLIFNAVKQYISPYKNKIENRDENFLINEIKQMSEGEFLDFKIVWSDKKNTSEVKEKIFKYMQSLINLTL